jgi:hypothetical protein
MPKSRRQQRKQRGGGGDKKLNVILDLDETVLYFLKAAKWAEVPEEEKPKYSIHGKKDVFVLRPHLREFMNELFANYNVSIWTWSDAEYAHDVANILSENEPEKFAYIWSADDADASYTMFGRAKDLNYIWYTVKAKGFQPCNTILVDDLDDNVRNRSNVRNSIHVKAFALFGTDKKRSGPYKEMYTDTTLLSVLTILKEIVTKRDFCAEGDLPFPFPSHTESNKPITGSNVEVGAVGGAGASRRQTRRQRRTRRP